MNGIYLFGILDGPRDLGHVRPPAFVECGGIEVLSARGASVAVAQVNGFRLDVPQSDLLGRLTEHERVLEDLMCGGTVLPVKFGTVLSSRDAVRAMLEQSGWQLARVLERFRGTIEIGVVASWTDLRRVLGELADHPELRAMRAEAERLPPPARTEAAVRVGRRVKELLDERAAQAANELLARLLPLARDVAENERRDDSMVTNTAFLVDLACRDRFVAEVASLDAQCPGRFDFRVIEPLPPHTFATVRIRQPDTSDLLRALQVLDLPPVASFRQVRDAQRRLGHALHPDHHPDDPSATGRFEEMNSAYRKVVDYLLDVPHRFDQPERCAAPFAEIKRIDEIRGELVA